MSLDVPFMSAFLNYRAQQTSYIIILCTTKILLLPRFLNVRFLACLDRDIFRSKYASWFRPWSFSMHCRRRHWGRGLCLLPLQRHTRETSFSTWLPMPAVINNLALRFSNFFEVGTTCLSQNSSADHLILVRFISKFINFVAYFSTRRCINGFPK